MPSLWLLAYDGEPRRRATPEMKPGDPGLAHSVARTRVRQVGISFAGRHRAEHQHGLQNQYGVVAPR